jgi:hypothetical protein
LIAHLVEARGTLAAVALHLAEQRGFAEDVESVERGLRRLRNRGTTSGGVWGERVLRCFGLPGAVTDRIRWMGQYHRRFTDLPAGLCEELLRPWNRPPVSQSPARIWLLMAEANLSLRRREDATALIEMAEHLLPRVQPVAVVEWALLAAYVWSRRDPPRAAQAMGLAQTTLPQVQDPHDRACLFARWIDQAAYPLNKPTAGLPDRHAALALYEQISADGPLFARCRRENGLGWTRLKLGDADAAIRHAEASMRAAGDSGSLRLRAMALNLLAKATDGARSEAARQRALAIAARLEDEALALRFRPRQVRSARSDERGN